MPCQPKHQKQPLRIAKLDICKVTGVQPTLRADMRHALLEMNSYVRAATVSHSLSTVRQ